MAKSRVLSTKTINEVPEHVPASVIAPPTEYEITLVRLIEVIRECDTHLPDWTPSRGERTTYILSEDISEPGVQPFFFVRIARRIQSQSYNNWLTDGETFWPVDLGGSLLASKKIVGLSSEDAEGMKEAIRRYNA